MITAVDTNILLDVFLPDKNFVEPSSNRLKIAFNQGGLIICDIVYAELVPQFKKRSLLDNTLELLNISISPLDREAAFLAGNIWGHYKEAGGKRDRIITDFLIAGHAVVKADRFLTRDRGFYKSYFPDLVML
jgi:predicted nucleic acid-binding protein